MCYSKFWKNFLILILIGSFLHSWILIMILEILNLESWFLILGFLLESWILLDSFLELLTCSWFTWDVIWFTWVALWCLSFLFIAFVFIFCYHHCYHQNTFESHSPWSFASTKLYVLSFSTGKCGAHIVLLHTCHSRSGYILETQFVREWGYVVVQNFKAPL